MGLSYKLVLFPALLFLIHVELLSGSGQVIRASILEAAMAQMITASILATSHGLKPRLANMIVGVGIPLSLFTLAVRHWTLERT